MSATNETENYGLPQFVGSDKPSWLGDVNSAMGAIDSQMKTNADGITSLGTDLGLTDTKATNAFNTANTALTKATSLEGKFNLSNRQSKTAPELISVTGLTATGRLYLAQDETGSVFKFYNYIELANNSGSYITINLTAIPGTNGLYGIKAFNLAQAPEEAYTVLCAGMNYYSYPPSLAATDLGGSYFVVGTDGGIYFNINDQASISMPSGQVRHTTFSPCIYFNVNFGDEE